MTALVGLAVLGWLMLPGGEPSEAGAELANAGGESAATADADTSRADDTSTRTDARASERTSSQAPDRQDTGPNPQLAPDDAPAFTLDAPTAADAGSPEPDAAATALAQRDSRPSADITARSADASPAPAQADRQQAQADQGDADDPDPVDRARSVARNADGELQRGMDLIAEREFVEGRRVLSRLLFSGQLSNGDARTVRDTLASVNRELIFSDHVASNDSLVTRYTVQPGDRLASIAQQFNVPYQFVMQINGIRRARDLQAGQNIKLIKGPFHARVHKSDFRMDITIIGPDGELLYVCSFRVGLGEDDSTPPGEWIVAPGRKVVNPSWRNPRTGEFFSADDPQNPIGNYWIALEGTEAQTRDLRGYGIHGTIEPETVGQQRSMGCIRLLDDDIEQVFHMLQEGHSRVSIIP